MNKIKIAIAGLLALLGLTGTVACKPVNVRQPHSQSTWDPYPYATPANGDALVLVIGRDIPAGGYSFNVPGTKEASCHYEIELPGGQLFPNNFANGGDHFLLDLPGGGGKLITLGCGLPKRIS